MTGWSAVGDEGLSRQGVIRRLQQAAGEALRDVSTGSPFCLLDFPDHRNVGDSAIWLGEETYFREHRGAGPRYVASLTDFSEAALRAAAPDGPIFLHGGGNFGDLYPRHQEFREHVLERFPDREVIQLPQSIHFADSARVTRAARVIAHHRRFRLLVRDQPSYDFAAANFDCEVGLCPDMALFLGVLDRRGAPEVDVLYLLRTDQERVVGAATGRRGGTWRATDWLAESRFSVPPYRLAGIARTLAGGGPLDRAALRRASYAAVARARTARGCRILSAGRVVVTDRLHAHLLCLLLGIPHAALDNSYGKLGRFLDAWTGEAPGVRRATSLEEAEEWASSLLQQPL